MASTLVSGIWISSAIMVILHELMKRNNLRREHKTAMLTSVKGMKTLSVFGVQSGTVVTLVGQH